jgi:glycosyltransferase involved in cell wall biosynthesis
MISICIPTYEMDGEGVRFLSRSLESIATQTFTDYEILVSDHSVADDLETVCRRYAKVRYLRNPRQRGNSSANLNNAIDHARGGWIKVIFQDDFLSGSDSLSRMAAGIGEYGWLVHAYWHTDLDGKARRQPTRPSIPAKREKLLVNNSIGAPTAVMFRKSGLRFDESLRWVMDCEFYYRLLRLHGVPAIIHDPLAVQTLWPGQLTHKLTAEVKDAEAAYVQKKLRSGGYEALSRQWT